MSNRNGDPDPWDDPLWYAQYRTDPNLGRAAPRGPRLAQMDWPRLGRAVMVALVAVGLLTTFGALAHRPRGAGDLAREFALFMAAVGLRWYVSSTDDRWLTWGLYAGIAAVFGPPVVRLALVLT